jgi:ABC-type amino acid transport substrate-binding protein
MTERLIRVGIDDAPPPPMQLGNPDTGDFRGYEVDVLKEVSRRAGFRLSFRRALWSVIVRELVTGEVDLVCSAATITREREREVDFCVPHLNMSLAVVKRNGISTDAAITGLRLGVRRGTTAEAYLRQHITVEPMHLSESNDELYALLSAGALDAVIDDSPIAGWFSHSVPGLQFAGVLPGTEAAYGIMVRKEDDKLRSEINSALEEMANDGTRQTLLLRWFREGSSEVNR